MSRIILLLLIVCNTAMATKYNFFLSRGLVREKRHWGDFATKLKKKFPGSEVVLLEIPGAGIYNKKEVPKTVAEIVEFMRIDYLKEVKKLPPNKNVIMAMSFGGMIGTEWIINHPQDFQFAIFGNTSYSGFCSTLERFKPQNFLNVLRFPFAEPGEDRELLVLKMISNRPELHKEASKKWGKILESAPVSTKNIVKQLMAAYQYEAPVDPPKIPMLLLASKNDHLVDVRCSEQIHLRWNVPIRFHNSAGHVIALDAPDWILTEVSDWLSSQKKGPI